MLRHGDRHAARGVRVLHVPRQAQAADSLQVAGGAQQALREPAQSQVRATLSNTLLSFSQFTF